jgi:hypothetical protein
MRMFDGSSDGFSMVAELMGSAGRAGADKCILTSFGSQGKGGALFRVRHMHIHSHMHHTLSYIHICTTHIYTFIYIYIHSHTYTYDPIQSVLVFFGALFFLGVVHMLLYVYISSFICSCICLYVHVSECMF